MGGDITKEETEFWLRQQDRLKRQQLEADRDSWKLAAETLRKALELRKAENKRLKAELQCRKPLCGSDDQSPW